MTNQKLILIGVGVIAVYFLFIKKDDDDKDDGGKKSGSGS
jgi:hypothetical protein